MGINYEKRMEREKLSRKVRELALSGMSDQQIVNAIDDLHCEKIVIKRIRDEFKIPSGYAIRNELSNIQAIKFWNMKQDYHFVAKSMGMSPTGAKTKLVNMLISDRIKDPDKILTEVRFTAAEMKRRKATAIKIWNETKDFGAVAKSLEISVRAAKAKIRGYILKGECENASAGLSGIRPEPRTLKFLRERRIAHMSPWLKKFMVPRHKVKFIPNLKDMRDG